MAPESDPGAPTAGTDPPAGAGVAPSAGAVAGAPCTVTCPDGAGGPACSTAFALSFAI